MDLLFIDDLFDPESLEAYKLTSYPFNLSMVKERLDARLQEDPEYEVFLPVKYYKLEKMIKDKLRQAMVEPFGWFVSNKGRVYSSRHGRVLKARTNDDGYPVHSGHSNGTHFGLLSHRMVACSFIPLKESHCQLALHPKDLQVNHLDGIKDNPSYGNLEWATDSENMLHAYETNLRLSGGDREDCKPLKGRVIRGNYIGYEFILLGRKNITELGFDSAACRKVAIGKDNYHRNCVFFDATDDEVKSIPNHIPESILKDIRDTCPLAKFKTIGTNIKTGEVVSFIGKRAGKLLGFSSGTIAKVVSGERPHHKGYTWRHELIKTGS